MEAWKKKLEAVLRQVPGYDPWAQAGAIGAWLDHRAAIDAINFFAERMKHVEGDARGEPFVLRPWQAAAVGNLFGWKRKDEKGRIVRRYRKCLLYVPRGNGKTPLASGIVLYVFYEDGEPGAQNFLAAGQREQASILFRNARGMVEQDPELLAAVDIYAGDQHRSMILKEDNLSFCKVIPADAGGQHGGIPHCIVVDEVHVQKNRDLMDVFETGMAKKTRAQPLLIMITTADFDRPSICNEVYDHACKVRDNGGRKDRPGFDPTFLPVVYEAGQDADWKDEKIWARANPNLGISVSLESLREACTKAIENPAFENTFRRLHLNQRTGQDVRLIPLDQWDACCVPSLKIEDYHGKPCFGGLDLSSKEDLTSFYLIFPMPGDVVDVWGWSFCPAEKIRQRARKKRVPYDVWARAGLIIETPGDSVDYGMVREKIVECDRLFQIQHLYVDPAGARETATILMEQYGFADRLVELTQSMNELSSPTKDLIFRVKGKKLRHNGNPVTRWAAGNLAGYFKGTIPAGETLANYLDKVPVMPSKQSSADKIDPIAAIVNALAAKASNPTIGGTSVYEERGVLAF